MTKEGSSSALGDSTLIIKHMVELGYLEDLNVSKPSTTRAYDIAIRALLEDRLYFYHTRERWLENYYVQRDKALWSIPYPIRVVVGLLVHRKISKMLQTQGTGRYTADEIRLFKLEVWEAINELLESSSRQLGQKVPQGEPFWCLGGEGPTEADVVLYGFVVSVLVGKSGPESTKLVRGFPVIMDYAERIHQKYFPDYQKWE
ncbi:hypothetical protein B0A49_09382 [Cryomyces minteri]|uniref:Thioredoxin-like fold domain-containing protein n=1 Tax=Cryomyces minteri TaxID=331657 RepID=A0A4U0WKI6_9PEZI|nr:hypothetical protein B0A49_09382 [Cryomyces minteri]